MTQRMITCPYCASQVTGDSTVCPGCQEDLAALAHLEYADAIHYNQALALAREGRPREAKAELAESLAANSEFAPAYALLAKLCARELDWANARINIKKALSLLPEDEAIVKLADEVINAAPASEVTPYVEVVEIPANPAAIERSRTIAEVMAANALADSLGPAGDLPPGDQEQGISSVVTTPVAPIFAPVRPVPVGTERRLASGQRREPGRPTNQSGQPARPSSYLLPPQETTQPTSHAPVRTLIDREARSPYLDAPADYPPEPDSQPLSEFAATPDAAEPPTADSLEPLFKGSLWRTLVVGILITAGLAILIRAMSGED